MIPKPRFTIKILCATIAVFGVLSALASYRLQYRRQIQRTQDDFRKRGVFVQFDSHGKIVSASFSEARAAGQPLPPVHKRPEARLLEIGEVNTLENLSFNGAKCVDDDLKNIQSLELKWIDLSNTQITDAGLWYLEGMSSLTELLVNHTGVTDNGTAVLATLPNLKKLSLMQTGITDATTQHLQALSHLEYLNLGGNALSDNAVMKIQGMESLRTLCLNGERIDASGRYLDLVTLTDKGLSAIATLHNLEYLELSNSALDDDSLKFIGQLQKLKYLTILRNASLTDKGLEHLTALTELQELFISSPNISKSGIQNLQREIPKCQVNWQEW